MQNQIVKILVGMLVLCAAARGPSEDTGSSQRFAGIGVQVKLSEGGVLLERVFQGSPAEGAGLKSGENILEVDGRSVVGLPLEEAIKQIVGPEGSEVRLRVAGLDGVTREVVVTRGKIELPEKSPEDFLGSYGFKDEAETEVHVTPVRDDVYRVECPKENWTAMGIIYHNRYFKTFRFKGYYQMNKTPPVHANMQGVVGFVAIDYLGPGRLRLMRAWNLKGGTSSDVSSKILIKKADKTDTGTDK